MLEARRRPEGDPMGSLTPLEGTLEPRRGPVGGDTCLQQGPFWAPTCLQGASGTPWGPPQASFWPPTWPLLASNNMTSRGVRHHTTHHGGVVPDT